jgi:hypothetical protein
LADRIPLGTVKSPTSLNLTQFGRALCERQTSTSGRALKVMLRTKARCNRGVSSVPALKCTIAVAAMIEVVDVAIAGVCSLMVFEIVGIVAVGGSCVFVVVVVVVAVVELCLFVVVGVVVVVCDEMCLFVVAERCLFVVFERLLSHWTTVARE